MQFAINKFGQRVRPENSGQREYCPLCGGVVIGKCGTIYVRHWQHKQDKSCDSWKEHETVWHREWKAMFPESWQEYLIEKNAERHIADIKRPDNLVIEFQNSSISTTEISIREQFYNNMIWVVNAQSFKDNFVIRSNVTSKLRVLDDQTSKKLRIVNRTFKESAQELTEDILRIQNKLREKERSVSRKEEKYAVISEYLSKSDEYYNAVISKWINNEGCTDNLNIFLINGINYGTKTKFQELSGEVKNLSAEIKRLKNAILDIQGLSDFEGGGSKFKIVEYSHLNSQNYKDAKVVSKSSMYSLFHDIKGFNSDLEFYSYKSRKDLFVFLINPDFKLKNFSENILECENRLQSEELLLSTLKEEMRLQLIQELNKNLNKVKDEIEIMNMELDEIDLNLTTLLHEQNDLKNNLEEKMNYFKDDIFEEHNSQSGKIKRENKGVYSLDWKHERRSWQVARRKIYFDIGENYLFERISDSELRKISKEIFVKDQLDMNRLDQSK